MKKAFTLIELLVVVLIIGILSAVALPQYQKAMEKARSVEVLTLLRVVLQAEQEYYLANGTTTSDLTALSVNLPAKINNSTTVFTIKDTLYRISETEMMGLRTYKSQTYILQANFSGEPTDPCWQIVCAAPEGNNICQLLGFSATSYASGGYGKYYRKA